MGAAVSMTWKRPSPFPGLVFCPFALDITPWSALKMAVALLLEPVLSATSVSSRLVEVTAFPRQTDWPFVTLSNLHLSAPWVTLPGHTRPLPCLPSRAVSSEEPEPYPPRVALLLLPGCLALGCCFHAWYRRCSPWPEHTCFLLPKPKAPPAVFLFACTTSRIVFLLANYQNETTFKMKQSL